MRRILERARKVAKTGLLVLLLGETGTGKDLLARYIDFHCGRSGRFVVVDCAARRDNLLADDLWGHEKGGFTSASSSRKGLVEEANMGTLFFDEIGELSPDDQTALLRLIETGTFRKIGSNKVVGVDVRVVAATNRDLKAMVEEGTFRSDLYYRLFEAKITIPPLRERREDVPLIAQYLADVVLVKKGLRRRGIAPEALHVLQSYDWPGNARELRGILIRASLDAAGDTITANDIRRELQDEGVSPAALQGLVARFAQVLVEQEGHARLATLEKLTGFPREVIEQRMERLVEREGFQLASIAGQPAYLPTGSALEVDSCASCPHRQSSGDEQEPQADEPAEDTIPETPEEVALRLVREGGKVTTRALCNDAGVTKDAASKLLGRLVRSGLLERRGGGRGAHYVEPA